MWTWSTHTTSNCPEHVICVHFLTEREGWRGLICSFLSGKRRLFFARAPSPVTGNLLLSLADDVWRRTAAWKMRGPIVYGSAASLRARRARSLARRFPRVKEMAFLSLRTQFVDIDVNGMTRFKLWIYPVEAFISRSHQTHFFIDHQAFWIENVLQQARRIWQKNWCFNNANGKWVKVVCFCAVLFWLPERPSLILFWLSNLYNKSVRLLFQKWDAY